MFVRRSLPIALLFQASLFQQVCADSVQPTLIPCEGSVVSEERRTHADDQFPPISIEVDEPQEACDEVFAQSGSVDEACSVRQDSSMTFDGGGGSNDIEIDVERDGPGGRSADPLFDVPFDEDGNAPVEPTGSAPDYNLDQIEPPVAWPAPKCCFE